jgi:hypothetical protein
MKCKGEEHGGRTVTQFICTECSKVAQRVTTQFFKLGNIEQILLQLR